MASGVCTEVLGGGRNLGLTYKEKTSLKAPREPMNKYLGFWVEVLFIIFCLKGRKAIRNRG